MATIRNIMAVAAVMVAYPGAPTKWGEIAAPDWPTYGAKGIFCSFPGLKPADTDISGNPDPAGKPGIVSCVIDPESRLFRNRSMS